MLSGWLSLRLRRFSVNIFRFNLGTLSDYILSLNLRRFTLCLSCKFRISWCERTIFTASRFCRHGAIIVPHLGVLFVKERFRCYFMMFKVQMLCWGYNLLAPEAQNASMRNNTQGYTIVYDKAPYLKNMKKKALQLVCLHFFYMELFWSVYYL